MQRRHKAANAVPKRTNAVRFTGTDGRTYVAQRRDFGSRKNNLLGLLIGKVMRRTFIWTS